MTNAQGSLESSMRRPPVTPHEELGQHSDFIDFLSERLDTSRATAMDVLTSLVEGYRSESAYEISMLVSPDSVGAAISG